MDFMKILKSLEEALYEVMVWLVFYPVTFWKVLVHPSQMMEYADDELDDEDEDRYSDKLSPPIFLAITLVISHLVELGLGESTEKGLLADDQNLLAFRMIVFSVYPLVLAVRLLRRLDIALDRKTLRAPFYSQCYVAAPFALLVGASPELAFHFRGQSLEALGIALAIIMVGVVWYLALQARWFARLLNVSWGRGMWHAIVTWVEATVIVLVVTTIVARL